jgi:hypothetical protein
MLAWVKGRYFYISLILGALFSFWSYGYWLWGLFPQKSMRLLAAVIVALLMGTAISYFIAIRLVVPEVKKRVDGVKIWFWISCVFLGLFLFASAVNFSYLQSRYIYLLLPQQKLEIEARQKDGATRENITIQGLNTSIGEIRYQDLQIEGWTRNAQDSKQLSLENMEKNHISWVGQTGGRADLLFETSPDGGKVVITWNSQEASYDLYSAEKGTLKVGQDFVVPVYAGWLPLGIIMALAFILLFCVLFTLVLGSNATAVSPRPRRFDWLWYALPMFLVWIFYLTIFYPGFLSKDSIDQWRQMVTGQYVDWHPPMHTLTNWLITRVWYSPAAIAMVQIAMMSGVLGWGLAVTRRAGSPEWLTWLTSILLAISPANGSLVITIWKDIPFSILVTALTILVLEILLSKGKWLEKKGNWAVLGVLLVLVTFYRQNGILVSVGTLLALLIAYRACWRKLALSMVLFLVVCGVIKGLFYPAIHVQSSEMARYQLVLYNLVAAHQNNGTMFLPSEKELVRGGFPKEKLPYVCYRNTNLVLYVDQNHRNYLVQNTLPLVRLTINLTLRSPRVTLNHFACNGWFVYRIFQVIPRYAMVYAEIYRNKYGIKSASLFPAFRPGLMNFITLTLDQNGASWFIWRSSFWMFLFAAGNVVSCLRNKTWKNLLVLLPAFLVVLPMIFLSLGQIFRYVYPMYLCGILLSGFFWVNALRQPKSDDGY